MVDGEPSLYGSSCPCGDGHSWTPLGWARRYGLLWELGWYRCGVVVQWWYDRGLSPGEVFYFRTPGNPWVGERSVDGMVNKYIEAARSKQLREAGKLPSLDEVIGGGRPALSAFLTEVDAGDGRVRERSVLMVTVDEDGLRVGLKDEALGGWLWRTSGTLAGALDSIETALQNGTAAFGGSGRSRRKGR